MLYSYWAALCMLDAELLFSDNRVRDLLDPEVTAPRSIERHHLFPKAHLRDIGVTTTPQQNAIANMAFLDWPDNARIGASGPKDYWPQMAGALDPQRLKKQIYCHALPVGWEQLDYDTFLERRRGLIAQVMRDAFERLWEGKPSAVPTTLEDLIAAGES